MNVVFMYLSRYYIYLILDSRDEKAQQLSEVLQKEIRREIKLRISDLETVEENIYLCKKYLLKLRQAVTTECYKQKHSKVS